MKEKFIEFLKKEDVYDRFMKCFSRENEESLDEYIDARIKEHAENDFILTAFAWDDDLWITVNDEWEEELSALAQQEEDQEWTKSGF